MRKPEEPPKQAQSKSRGFALLTLFLNSVTDSGPRIGRRRDTEGQPSGPVANDANGKGGTTKHTKTTKGDETLWASGIDRP